MRFWDFIALVLDYGLDLHRFIGSYGLPRVPQLDAQSIPHDGCGGSSRSCSVMCHSWSNQHLQLGSTSYTLAPSRVSRFTEGIWAHKESSVCVCTWAPGKRSYTILYEVQPAKAHKGIVLVRQSSRSWFRQPPNLQVEAGFTALLASQTGSYRFVHQGGGIFRCRGSYTSIRGACAKSNQWRIHPGHGAKAGVLSTTA